ncbi:sigma-70 domain-containing protein [Nostoc sp.]|uniref:sigma-70 domain-containing protein n=1 Tax=Nostoc sp. TaxID=1180 RepID=UPI002FFB619C
MHTSTEIAHPLSLEPNQLREFLLLDRQTISLDIRVGLEKDTQLQNLIEDCRYSDNSYTTVESLDHDI